MKTLQILVMSALVLGTVAAANQASASSVGVSKPGGAAWTHRGFIARNTMNFTPAAANGAGSDLAIGASGTPVNAAMAASGQLLPVMLASGSENTAAVTAFAARDTGTQVALAGAVPSSGAGAVAFVVPVDPNQP